MKKIKYRTFDDQNSISRTQFGGVDFYRFLGMDDFFVPVGYRHKLWMVQFQTIDKHHYENLMPPGFTQAVKFVKTTSRLFRRMKQWIKQNLSK